MADELKSYPARWSGRTLLACKKCQKKLRKAGVTGPLTRLGKTMRKREDGPHVVDVGCMDLCPKGGVAVCKPGEVEDRLYVVRTVEEIFRV